MTTPLAAMSTRLPQMIDDLATLVRCESPSADLGALAASADLVDAMGARYLGRAAERIVVDGRPHLRWRLGSGDRPVLLLGHHDTVWPDGSLATHPWRIDTRGGHDIARGPGCFDMKAGLVQMFHALAGLDRSLPVTVLVTADEEIGSRTSRELIESEARASRAALVLEASADGGAVKIERKGTSMYRVQAVGRAAHAGLEPHNGVNAGIEIAHQVLAVSGLGDAALGTTVVPTVLAAGTTTNTVPAQAVLDVDVRARTVEEQQRVHRAITGLTPTLPGAQIRVDGGPNRPPLQASSTADLFAVAADVWRELGLGDLGSAAVGGASDGNFTAGVGTPTLDGLGAVGGGAHADHEHVVVGEMPRRAALLAGIVTRLLAR